MQTFLPYPDFTKSAKVLDTRRLGKQRVECLQLLQTLTGLKIFNGHVCHYKPKGWVNHPAAKMWRGYEGALVDYALAVCDEWLNRGYKDTCLDKIMLLACDIPIKYPPWIGRQDIHASHRSNLLRKDPLHYSQFYWAEPNNLPYVWPV